MVDDDDAPNRKLPEPPAMVLTPPVLPPDDTPALVPEPASEPALAPDLASGPAPALDGVVPAPTLPAPVITALRTTAGTLAGGTRVVLEGTGFAEGCAVKVDRVAVTSALEGPTLLSFSTPARNVAGRVDVDVVNPDGQWTVAVRAFEYRPPPVLTSVTPDHGPQTGDVRATLAGADLRDGATVRIGASRPRITYHGPTRVDLVIGPHPAGTYDVELTSDDGQEARLPAAFHFQGPPSVHRVTPGHGVVGADTPVVIEGDGFRTGLTVYVDREQVAADLQSSTRIAVAVPARLRPCTVPVRVINVDGLDAELADAFRHDSPPGPRIARIDPASGERGVEHAAVLAGERFDNRCSVHVAGAPVPTRFVSSTRLDVTIPAIDRIGWVDVEVRGVDQSHVLEGAFEVRAAAAPPPSIRSVSPNRVGVRGGDEVTIDGDHFVPGCRVLVAGQLVPTAKVRDPQTIVLKIPAGEAGAMVDVAVRTPGGEQAVARRAVLYDPRYG